MVATSRLARRGVRERLFFGGKVVSGRTVVSGGAVALLVLTAATQCARARDVEPPLQVTFTKHIAPLLWKHCAGCHRAGEVGPFPLLAYDDAAKRADFLAEVAGSRRMPPWKPEPNFGKFHGERRLSDDEIALLDRWAKSGAPEGDPKDLPKQPKFPQGWQLGEPDMILKMAEPFTIPAGGSDVYRCFVIPIPIDANRMVSAIEFRPGNSKVVHHAILFLDANGQARKKDGVDGKPGYATFGGPGILPTGGLGAWVPGATFRFLPDGIVKYLKQGSDLVLQLHYHPSGKEETDQSVVGLHFSELPAKKIVTGIAVLQTKLKLPPGESHCEVTAQSAALPVDVNVMGVSPHMHNLGREFRVTATRPDTSEEVPLIWIKDWDFNWQGAYQFEQPIALPKGSVIKVRAVYDNSSDNPKNPNNPPKVVRWGEATRDEMCLCGVQVYTDRILDLKQIVAMRGNELGPGLDGGIPGQADTVKKHARGVAKQAAAKKSAEEKAAAVPFPPGGVPIPPQFQAGLSIFDQDQDGKLSRAEVAKMPLPLQKRVERALTQEQSTAKAK